MVLKDLNYKSLCSLWLEKNMFIIVSIFEWKK